MTDDPSNPPTLDYADDPGQTRRRRTVKRLVAVIVLKLVMVAVNVGLAFSTVGALPRMIGVGVQVGLTLVFLVLLLQLISADRHERPRG